MCVWSSVWTPPYLFLEPSLAPPRGAVLRRRRLRAAAGRTSRLASLALYPLLQPPPPPPPASVAVTVTASERASAFSEQVTFAFEPSDGRNPRTSDPLPLRSAARSTSSLKGVCMGSEGDLKGI